MSEMVTSPEPVSSLMSPSAFVRLTLPDPRSRLSEPRVPETSTSALATSRVSRPFTFEAVILPTAR